MERISAEEARKHFSKLLGHVAFGDNVTIITRYGDDHAAMISLDALRRFQRMEEYIDGLEATEAIAEMKKKGGRTLDEILSKHGIERDAL